MNNVTNGPPVSYIVYLADGFDRTTFLVLRLQGYELWMVITALVLVVTCAGCLCSHFNVMHLPYASLG